MKEEIYHCDECKKKIEGYDPKFHSVAIGCDKNLTSCNGAVVQKVDLHFCNTCVVTFKKHYNIEE